jgi:hypothetical protein
MTAANPVSGNEGCVALGPPLMGAIVAGVALLTANAPSETAPATLLPGEECRAAHLISTKDKK